MLLGKRKTQARVSNELVNTTEQRHRVGVHRQSQHFNFQLSWQEKQG